VSDTALEARNLYKVFGRSPNQAVRRLQAGEGRSDVLDAGTAAVIDASFTVKRGEIFVVMGLSGSGKSTLIRMLNGLLPPTSGEVTIHGRNVTTASPRELRDIRRESVSMVFQHFALLPHRSVIDNAAYALEIQGVPKAERLERARVLLEKAGLGEWADSRPDELSGGMRQRVGLARALTAGTDVLLMDEAFSALDPLIRREMQEQLVELQHELGRTIIFITHDLNEAMFLGDRIAVMRDGRIVQNGTPEEILTDPANDYVAQFVQDVDRTKVLTARTVMEPPHLTTPVSAGVRGALRVLREQQARAVFATEGRRLVGVVTDRAVIRAVKAGQTDLRAIIDQSVLTVGPDDLLTDIVESAVESPVPLAVVDEKSLAKQANASGQASVTVTLPTNAVGSYTLTATGAESGSSQITINTGIAATGADVSPVLLWGAVGAVGLGVIALIAVGAVRRSRQTELVEQR